MISKVISSSSIISIGTQDVMVAYTIEASENQIIFSNDGIIYLRSDKFGMILNNSRSKNENVKKKESGFFNNNTEKAKPICSSQEVWEHILSTGWSE